MATDAKKFQIGLFVIVGITIAVAAIIALGASQFFSDTRNYVTYFNETVQGLERDSLVKFRGIPAGRVYQLGIAPDGHLAQVILKINDNVKITPDMVIQMRYAGITGMKYLEINPTKPGVPDKSPELDFRPPYPVIPSTPSDLQSFLTSIEKVVENVKNLDLAGISNRLKITLDDINKVLAKENWAKTVQNLQSTSASLRTASADVVTMLQKPGVENLLSDATQSMENMKQITSRLEKDLQNLNLDTRIATTTDKIDRFFDQATITVEDVNFILTQQEGNIFDILDNLRMASESLNNLAASLKANPAQILFSKPPAPEQ